MPHPFSIASIENHGTRHHSRSSRPSSTRRVACERVSHVPPVGRLAYYGFVIRRRALAHICTPAEASPRWLRPARTTGRTLTVRSDILRPAKPWTCWLIERTFLRMDDAAYFDDFLDERTDAAGAAAAFCRHWQG